MAKPYSYQPAGTVTVTTTGNIDNLDFSKCAVVLMNNASLATIRGLKAGYPGQRVTIRSIGAGQVHLAHQNAGSTAANRLINFVTGTTTPLAAGVGTALYVYDDATARWRLDTCEQGAGIDVAFNSGDFVGSGTMTWTLTSDDVETFRYRLVGNLLFLDMQLDRTTIGGTPTTICSVTIPNGFTPAKAKAVPCIVFDNSGSTYEIGSARVLAAGTTVDITRFANANYSLSTNLTYLRVSMWIEVT